MSLSVDAAVGSRGVDVALEVAEGETVALLGPNGAGKSTVLALAAGLLSPDRGQVVLDGRVLSDAGEPGRRDRLGRPGRGRTLVPPHDRRVSLLAQEPLLFPHLSVLDNVAFGPRSAGSGRHEARELARSWLAEVGAAELGDRRPVQLSGGQAQRAAVARALAATPSLLLLDEPMAALDVDVAPRLRQTLRHVLAERTVLMVTHDILDALLLADRVVVLDGGAVVEEGACARVLARPRSPFAARIAGLNLLRGRWNGTAVDAAEHRVEGRVGGPEPVTGDEAVAVFPPSAVSVYLETPHGSPRNSFPVTVTELEPQGGQIRVRAGRLSADVSVGAVSELDLAPGARVVFVVKAAEVAVYPT